MIGQQKRLLLALVVVALVGACAPSASVQPTPDPVTLRVVLLPYLSMAPLFIGLEEGYFTEQGLTIEAVELGLSSQAVPALAQGDIDVIPGSLYVGQLNAMAQGTTIRYVADNSHFAADACSQFTLLVRRALTEGDTLQSLAQLRGRPFSVNPLTFTGYVAEKMVQREGLLLEDFELVSISSAAELDALAKGSLDLAPAGEPWVTRIVEAGHAVPWVGAQEVLPDAQYAMILYGPTLLEQNPAAGRRFMVAYLQAVRQYNQGKTERNVEILAKHTGLDAELLQEACWPSVRSDGQINLHSVLAFQDWALQKGYLDSPAAAEQMWDPSFVEYASQRLAGSAD